MYKVMYLILQERIMPYYKNHSLIAEEQGDFRRGRGCRNQILTLLLLGQVKVAAVKKGCIWGLY